MRRPVAGAVVRCAVLKGKKEFLIGEESEEGMVKLFIAESHPGGFTFCLI